MRAAAWFTLAVILSLLSLATYPRSAAPHPTPVPRPAASSVPSVAPETSPASPTATPPAPAPPPPPVYQFDVYRTSDAKFIVTVPQSDDWVDTKIPVIVHEDITIMPGDGRNFSFKPVAFFRGKEYYLEGFGGWDGWRGIPIYTHTNEFPADLCETIKLRIFNAPVGTVTIELEELETDHDMDPSMWSMVGGEDWRNRYTQYSRLRAGAQQQQQQMIYSIPLR